MAAQTGEQDPQNRPNDTERRQTKSKRSRYVVKACNECKRRKIKCDGQEPCGACTTQLTQCSYDRPHNDNQMDWNEFQRMGEEVRSMRENLERFMNRVSPRSASDHPSFDSVAMPEESSHHQVSTPNGNHPDRTVGSSTIRTSASEPASSSEFAFDVAQTSLPSISLSTETSEALFNDPDVSKRRRNDRDLGRIKSCSQCRQHKLKCTVSQHPGTPCSRCLKMGLDCVVTRARANQRTKAQLARENEELRNRLNQSTLEIDRPVASAQTPDVQEILKPGTLNPNSEFLSVVSSSQREPVELLNPAITTSTAIPLDCDSLDTLDGLPISTTNICLQLFFTNYSSFLSGIFHSDMSFMSYHNQSPFLFWTMACTGARRFPDVGYFQGAAAKVRELVTTSLLRIQDPIPTIQAILILCLWPLPVDTMWKDPSHALAGAAMQLAVQNGLHKFRHEQDFRRIQINSTDRVKAFRLCLWLHCVIVFQRTSICDGLPFSAVLDSWSAETEASLELINNQRLVARYKMHQVQIRAITAITQNHNLQEPNDCKGISALINVFDSQIREIDAFSDNITLHMAAKMVRLSLLVFHLFTPEEDDMLPGAVCLFTVCTEILDLTARLDATQSLAWYSTHYHMRMILLAAFCVLRIMRSRLRDIIAVNDAEQSLFKAISFVKGRSTQPSDLDDRYVTILKQLYSSSVAFRREDGEVDGLHLDIRSRLFMSVAFDSFWWWRSEFDGRANPYQSPAATATSTATATAAAATAVQGGGGELSGEMDPTMPLDNELYDVFSSEDFANWHWPASLTFDQLEMPPQQAY